jgi:hypothetical protein
MEMPEIILMAFVDFFEKIYRQAIRKVNFIQGLYFYLPAFF